MSEFASYDSVESLYDNSQFYEIINYKSQQRPKLVATCFCTRKPGLYYAVDYLKKGAKNYSSKIGAFKLGKK